MDVTGYPDTTAVPACAMTGLNDPQALDPQVTVKFTPPSDGSLATWTLIDNVAFTARELGIGAVEAKVTPMGVDTMVRLTLLLCHGLLVTVAVIVTDVPIGISEGAV